MGDKLLQYVRNYEGHQKQCQRLLVRGRLRRSGAADRTEIGLWAVLEGSHFHLRFRELGVQIPWIGSPTTAAATSLKLAGPALYGSYAAVDFNRDSSMAAKEFAAKYETAYTSAPDFFASWAYDAVHVLALAINNAQSLDAQKIREAILSVKGYPGAEGT